MSELPNTTEAVARALHDASIPLVSLRECSQCVPNAKTAIAADRKALADAGFEIVSQEEIEELRDKAERWDVLNNKVVDKRAVFLLPGEIPPWMERYTTQCDNDRCGDFDYSSATCEHQFPVYRLSTTAERQS